MYTNCEAGMRRSVNHTRARSLVSPGRAEAVGVGVDVGVARPGRPDVTCGAVQCGATY